MVGVAGCKGYGGDQASTLACLQGTLGIGRDELNIIEQMHTLADHIFGCVVPLRRFARVAKAIGGDCRLALPK